MRKSMTLTAFAALLFTLPVTAEKIAIVGGKVHTLSAQGSLESATVLINNGQIESVNADAQAPEGYKVFDAKGKVVTPGIIGAYTSLGLVEVGLSAGVVDSTVDKRKFSKSGAALDVSYAVNPDSSLVNISRIEGVTAAATGISRSKRLFKGQGSIMSLGNMSSPVTKPRAFMTVNVSNSGAHDIGGSRAMLWPELENAIAEAEFFGSKGKDMTPLSKWHGQLSRADVMALQAVVNGDIPLLMDARRAADIRQVIAFKARHPKIDVVLLNATEGWRVAEEIAAAGIAVIVNPESNLPYGFDELGATLKNAARLQKAGVKVAMGMETHNIRLAKQHAGNAVANGLPWEEGLASLTRNVAEVYGIDNNYGSVQAGKVADLVIWSGDPLEVMEVAEQVFIGGKPINMESRQTKLRDRYLADQKGKPFGYVRP